MSLDKHVKILAHNLLPNFHCRVQDIPDYNVANKYFLLCNDIGLLAKIFALSVGISLCLCDAVSPSDREGLMNSAIAAESLGIILQNGIYDNVRRWYLRC